MRGLGRIKWELGWFLFALIVVFGSFQSRAQQEVFSEHLSTINGLNSNTVYHIMQDQNRFLWFSTDVGVSRYDGAVLTNFGYSDGLPDHDIFSVHESSDGTLWFLSFDGQLTTFKNGKFTPNKKLSFTTGHISGFLVDDNTIVVASYGEGIRIQRGQSFIHITGDQGQKSNFVSGVWQSKHAFFAMSPAGIHKIDKKSLKVSLVGAHPGKFHYGRYAQLSDGSTIYASADYFALFTKDEKITRLKVREPFVGTQVNAIQYRNDQLYVSTDDGLLLGNVVGDSLHLKRAMLDGNRVTWTFVDHEKNLWVSTLDNGVFRVSNLDIQQIDTRPVYSLSRIKNMITIGFNAGCFARVGKNDFYEVNCKSEVRDAITGYTEIAGTKLYLLPGSAHYVGEHTSRKINVGIASFLELGGDVLIGNQNGVHVITADRFISEVCTGVHAEKAAYKTYGGYKVKDIVRNGSEILVLTNKGVFIYEPGASTLREGRFGALKGKNISDIQIARGQIFVSTIGHGVFVYTGKKYHQFTRKDGIISNHILGLCLSEGGTPKVIANSHLGLSIMEPGNKAVRIRNISTGDGLPASDIIAAEVLDNILYLGTTSGCYRLKMDGVFAETTQPILQIRKVLLNDHRITKVPSSLAYWQNKLTIDLGTVAFRQQSDVKYLYQMNGSGNWEEAPNGMLSLISLMPGEYHVDVKVCTGGTCSEVRRISFTIAPPFWQTTWFRLSMVLLFIGIVYLFFRIRVLTYNRDVVRELLQVFLSRLKREESILVKDTKDGSLTKVPVMNIRYIKGADNYVELHLVDGDTMLVRDTMTNILDQKLSALKTPFVRCHRSYIVNGKRVDGVHNDFLKVGDEKIPIGKKYFQTIEQKKKVLSMH